MPIQIGDIVDIEGSGGTVPEGKYVAVRIDGASVTVRDRESGGHLIVDEGQLRPLHRPGTTD